MGDKLIKAITKDGFLGITPCAPTETVETAGVRSLSRVGGGPEQLVKDGIMMGAMLKGDEPTLTLQVRGDGPLGMMAAVAD